MCFLEEDCFLHTSVIHCESCALRSGLEKKNESKRHTRSTFSGKIGFVLSAAGASVGLGNI